MLIVVVMCGEFFAGFVAGFVCLEVFVDEYNVAHDKIPVGTFVV